MGQANPYCTIVFRDHKIKKINSRKRNASLATCYGYCTHVGCPMQVTVTVESETADRVRVEFSGDSIHNHGEIKSRKMSGKISESRRQEIKKPGVAAGFLFRKDLRNIDSERYAAGNYTGSGSTKKVYSHISAEANFEISNYEKLKNRLLKLEKKLKEEDQENSKIIARTKPFYGYLLRFTVTSSNLYACFSGAGQIMLYRDVVEIPDMLYFDATGSLFDDFNEFNRILFYSLTTRHPFGSTPPVPLFEFVSSEHTVGAIQRGLQDLRCYERVY